MPAEIRYHLIAPADLDGVVALHSELHVAMAGIESPRLYRAVAQDALRRGRAVCVVCTAGNEIAGCVTAIVNAAAYWRGFAWRRPALALRILVHRLTRPGPAGSAPALAGGPFETGPAPGSWRDSNDRIAKVQFIGVAPRFRGQGMGVGLYRHLAVHLRERGLARIDARVAADNAASTRLHHAAGWKLYPDAAGIFATLPLTAPDAAAR